jgi:hypothetical protein
MTEEYGSYDVDMPEPPKRSNTAIIIVVVILVLLCCCCITVASTWYLWNYGDEIFGLTQLVSNLLL